MHMADALLSPAVGGMMYVGAAAGAGWALHQMKKETLSEKALPLMAVSGAFVFAAQMINFTIPGTGSSGHIGGGILLAAMLGGCPAMLTMAVVLAIQCLFFADGGLLALGANIFNMGVIPCLIVYPLIFRPLMQWARKSMAMGSGLAGETGSSGRNGAFSDRRMTLAVVISAVAGLQLGAFGVVVETFFSGATELPFGTFMLLMQPIHLLIGAAEGIITSSILIYVNHSRPEILISALGAGVQTPCSSCGQVQESPEIHEKPGIQKNPEKAGSGKALDGISIRKILCVFAVLTLLVGGGLSLFASEYPDGLEWSIEKITGSPELKSPEQGPAAHAAQKAGEVQEKTAVMPDYEYADGGGGTSAAGILGAVLTCAAAGAIGGGILLARKVGNRKKKNR